MALRGRSLVASLVVAGLICSAASCVGNDPTVTPTTGAGTLEGPCFANGTCNGGLACVTGVCRAAEGGASIETGTPGTDGATSDGPTDSAAADVAEAGVAPTQYKAILSGQNEVPAVTTTGGGLANLSFYPDRSALCGRLSYSSLTGAPTAAHVHQGTAAVGGPVVLSFVAAAGAYTLNGTISPTHASELAANGLSVNIHTPNFASGEIRGQLVPDPGAPVQTCP